MHGVSSDYRTIIKTLYLILKPKLYLEVGCRNGETLRTIIESTKKSNTEFHAIDIRDVKKNLPKQVIFHLGSSIDVSKKWDKEIDMLFIDADHSADAVMQDFNIYSKWVKHNGIILLHDTFPKNEAMADLNNCGDAWKTAWEIRKKFGDEFEIVTLPIENGLSIIRKSKTQIDWQN